MCIQYLTLKTCNMGKPATKSCTKLKHSCSKCYKCSLSISIKSNKIVNNFPNELLSLIVDFLPAYIVYADGKPLFGNLDFINDPESVSIVHDHIVIQSLHETFYSAYSSSNQSIQPKQLISSKLNSTQNQSMINSLKRCISNFLGFSDAKETDINKWMIVESHGRYAHKPAFAMNCKTFKMYQIRFGYYKNQMKILNVYRMKPINSIFKSLRSSNGKDKIIKLLHVHSPAIEFLILFESGKLIEIPRFFLELPGELVPISGKDIFYCGYNFPLLIVDENKCIWHYNGAQLIKSWIFRGSQDIKKICYQYDHECICVLFEDGQCFIIRAKDWSSSLDLSLHAVKFQSFEEYKDVKIVDVLIFNTNEVLFLDDDGNLYKTRRRYGVTASYAPAPHKLNADELKTYAKNKIVKLLTENLMIAEFVQD